MHCSRFTLSDYLNKGIREKETNAIFHSIETVTTNIDPEQHAILQDSRRDLGQLRCCKEEFETSKPFCNVALNIYRSS
jgi:hypothetical protein